MVESPTLYNYPSSTVVGQVLKIAPNELPFGQNGSVQLNLPTQKHLDSVSNLESYF